MKSLMKVKPLHVATAILFVALLTSMFVQVTTSSNGEKGKYGPWVYVANWPAEKPTSLTINVTLNQPFTFVVGQEKLLGEANVDGWTYAGVYIYLSTSPARSLCYFMSFRTSAMPQIRNQYFPTHDTMGYSCQIMYMRSAVYGPILDIWVYGMAESGEGAGFAWQSNVTVSLYLTR